MSEEAPWGIKDGKKHVDSNVGLGFSGIIFQQCCEVIMDQFEIFRGFLLLFSFFFRWKRICFWLSTITWSFPHKKSTLATKFENRAKSLFLLYTHIVTFFFQVKPHTIPPSLHQTVGQLNHHSLAIVACFPTTVSSQKSLLKMPIGARLKPDKKELWGARQKNGGE